jgi:hypothetical protein
MNNLIDFYDYSGVSFSCLYYLCRDEMEHDFDPHEYTKLGIQVCDHCEFEALCELHGCIDANL